MTQTHTAGPWKQNGATVYYELDSGLTEKIAHVSGGDFRKPHPNAAFIVRACNAHDDLLDALKDVECNLRHCDLDDDTCAKIRAAIAKAEA